MARKARVTLARVGRCLSTAIGLVAATSLGTLLYLGGRTDALSARMGSRFGAMDPRFDAILT